MADIYFLTSNLVKLSHARHIARNLDVHIRKQDYYGAAYSEPRIDGREELLDQSLKDGIRRMAGVPMNSQKDDESFLFDQMPLGASYYDSLFFIEDTSVIIHALSSSENEFPGTDVKYWMKETSFDQLDALLKQAGNDRRVTVRSDVCLHIPRPEGLKVGVGESFIRFMGESSGSIVDKEYEFEINPIFPWLDNKTFNKWFVPNGSQVPISMLPIDEATTADFRQQSIGNMFEWLLETGLVQKKKARKVRRGKQALFSFARNHLFLVSGYPCSGKTTIGEYLSRNMGFHHIEASDFMRHAYHQRHGYTSSVPLELFACRILEQFPETVVDGVLSEIDRTDLPDVVITGLRSPDEIRIFKEQYSGAGDVRTVFLEADTAIRYERSDKRGREDALRSLSEFEKRDGLQTDMGLGVVEGESQYRVENNGRFEAFYRQFETVFSLRLTPLDLEKAKFITKYEHNLEGRILLFFLIDELVADEREAYSTTEISKGINRVFTENRFQTEKDNVSRYFNFRSHPYYRAFPDNGVVRFALSATGRSLATKLARVV
ncbi:hypothetical protein PDESU_00805 [Pontiella desulfatans]|uniref:Uncharacterized protein n=1 Tax=Pontiella desulfatans TaxID=2750659 RepID=A0A6C2TXL7_PONDE|nr:non-canonical purine NTP pyrophosphatase [Pontiella desulfatans]VGO12254.1 hypothetical protein PDESU_00805 [Pontiella desulfatans]